MKTVTAVLVILCVLGCKSKSQPPAPDAAAAVAPTSTAGSPLAPSVLRTTAGEIALGNLDSQIRGSERMLELRPTDLQGYAVLVDLLLERGLVRGRLADYERALVIAERVADASPDQPVALLARARARARLHRFDAAGKDVERAARAGAPEVEVLALRATLLAARGKVKDALAIAEQLAQKERTLASVGGLAVARAQVGQLEEAEQLFTEAQRLLPNTSPFQLAWLYFQQGLMWQEAGRPARARELFVAARERVPNHAQATAHLAAVEAAREGPLPAIALLEPLARQSDDPEYLGLLAEYRSAAGQADVAAQLRDEARRRYAALLERHPAAFASHAARFFLGPGQDPARALELGEQHLAAQPDAEAHRLLLEAALAAAKPARACEVAEGALRLDHVPPPLEIAAAKSFIACGQRERGERLIEKPR